MFTATLTCAGLPQGSLDDSLPSLVYDSTDGSLWMDNGGYGALYDISVSSYEGIINGFNATSLIYFATDYQASTLPGQPIYDGDALGNPGFLPYGEQESWLRNDLSYSFRIDPFGSFYTSDFVYLEEVEEIPGDLDGDGFVGLSDLDIILNNWNMTVPPADPRADRNGDDFVGLDDLDVVLLNWNAGTPPAQAVPEPATATGLALLLGLGLMRRR